LNRNYDRLDYSEDITDLYIFWVGVRREDEKVAEIPYHHFIKEDGALKE